MYVARSVILRALRATAPPHAPHRLTVTEHDNWWVTISDNAKWTLKEYLPLEVTQRTVNHLCERFNVPKTWLYEPLSIPGEEEQVKPS